MKPFTETVSYEDPMFPVLTFFQRRWAKEKTPMHWHEELEILYVLEGQITLAKGRNEYVVNGGQLAILNRGEPHSVCPADGTTMLLLQFGLELLQPAFPDSAESAGFARLKNGLDYPFPINAAEGAGSELVAGMMNIHELYVSLFHQKSDKELLFRMRGELFRLAGLLLEHYGHLEKPSDSFLGLRRLHFMQRASAFIRQHLTRPVTNQEAARAFHVSPRHFSTLFKAYTGLTFKEYLLLSRTNYAAELLLTDMSVTEIAHACGFNNLNTFNRVFKKYKRQTPTAYRYACTIAYKERIDINN